MARSSPQPIRDQSCPDPAVTCSAAACRLSAARTHPAPSVPASAGSGAPVRVRFVLDCRTPCDAAHVSCISCAALCRRGLHVSLLTGSACSCPSPLSVFSSCPSGSSVAMPGLVSGSAATHSTVGNVAGLPNPSPCSC
eukprot:1904335-Prymnesium_polylepis.1